MQLFDSENKEQVATSGALHDEKFVDETMILSFSACIAFSPISSFPTSKSELSIKKFMLFGSTFVYEKCPFLELSHFVQQNFR